MFKTIIEPFRIKVVEQIKMTTPEQRQEMIRERGLQHLPRCAPTT